MQKKFPFRVWHPLPCEDPSDNEEAAAKIEARIDVLRGEHGLKAELASVDVTEEGSLWAQFSITGEV